MEEDKTITKPNPSSILQLQAATITNTTTTSTTTAATIANPPATVPTTTAPAILQTKVLPTINATATNIPTSESRKNIDDQVKPQRLSDDSDTTLQSELENADTRALLGVPAVDSKAFSSRHALDQILHPNSGQAITAARMEVEVDVGADNTDKIDQCEAYKKPQKGAGANDGGEGEEAAVAGCGDTGENIVATENETTPTGSIRSIGSLVCRICHNSENPDKLVSPCLCKGSLTYVHVYCLERWISTSRSTVCELCQFQYNTEQTLRYTCFQSLRMWYSRSMSRRALQEDCQMFSLLTLVAFGIIGTLLVGIQYYFLQGRTWGLSRIWTKGWLIFFLLTTLAIYFINIYMIVRSQLAPWYRWWQSARDIKLILENRKPFKFRQSRRLQNRQVASDLSHMSMLHPYSPQQHQIPELNYPDQVQPPAAAPIPPPPPPPPTPTTANIAITAIDMGASDEELTCRKLPLASAASVCCVAMTASATIEIPLEGYLYEFDTVS